MNAKNFCNAIINMTMAEREDIFNKLEGKINPTQDPAEQMRIIEEVFIENNISF